MSFNNYIYHLQYWLLLHYDAGSFLVQKDKVNCCKIDMISWILSSRYDLHYYR